MKKAQKHSLDDQRGRIDSQHLEIPEFLLSHNLIKSHSKSQNILNYSNSLNDSVNFKVFKSTKSHLSNFNKSTVSLPITASNFLNNNNDTSIISNVSIKSSSKLGNLNFKSNTLSRSRSPIVIVYDNEDYNLDKTQENANIVPQSEQKLTQDSWRNEETEFVANMANQDNNYKINHKNYMNILRSPVNYESISETNTPIKSYMNLIEESKRNHQLNSVSAASLEQSGLDNSKINSKISYV